MLLKDLKAMYECGALNITYDEGDTTATLGGMKISVEQANAICKKLGWTDWLWSSFKIIDKTAKFVKGIRNSITNESVLNDTDVTFHNRDSSRYFGKKFDRIFLNNEKKGTSYCIVYNMPGSKATYEVYDHNKTQLVAECSTLKQVGEFINNN